jgi:5-methylcytosine-specific restriction endonuclease McrA
MKSILDSRVLCLNSSWIPIGFCTLKKALEDMNSCKSPKKALKIEFWEESDGVFDFDQITEMTPLNFEEWINLPLRKHDPESCVRTTKLEIRSPQVIISPFYNKIPIKTFRPTKRHLYDRYGGKCFWTGDKLSYKEMTIDHVTSRDEWTKKKKKGSPNNWLNLAPSRGDINRLKSNLPPEEFESKYGYKPQYKLSEPGPVSASTLIKEALFKEWVPFLLK